MKRVEKNMIFKVFMTICTNKSDQIIYIEVFDKMKKAYLKAVAIFFCFCCFYSCNSNSNLSSG
jgi:hypothetical protein